MSSRFKGYTGRVLDIDLDTGDIRLYPLADADRERYLGGRLLSTKILWDELPAGIDPLSSKNILVIMTSPLTGTGAPSSSRFDISAKSPLTGCIGHSNSGGSFGIHLKRAGYDGVVIRGKAPEPVYIDIGNEGAKIRPAGHLWGMDTEQAQALLDRKGRLVIGPAGENLVRYAVAASGERIHGRTGMGAVMGSKHLKALTASGKNRIETAEPEKFRAAVKKWTRMIQKHPATGDLTPKYGTAQFVNTLNRKKALPTRNFSRGSFAGAENLSGERLARDHLVKNTGCISCPIRCGRVVEYEGREIKGPEYEVLCMMGTNLEIDDLPAIIRWNYELDRLGLDTISVGNTLGFAAELNEKGLWKNGIEFGRKDNISRVIEDIAYRRGIGAELGQGVRFLARKYGGEEFAAHSKGLELAGYEPRAAVGHGLGYATANRGACHLDGGYMIYFEAAGPLTLDPAHYRSKPAWTILDQNLLAAVGAGGNCLFTAWTFVPRPAYRLPGMKWTNRLASLALTYTWGLVTLLVKMPPVLLRFNLPLLPHSRVIRLATGMRMDFGRFLRVGDRGYNLERLFNLREGIGADTDRLAGRFTEESLPEKKPKSVVPLKRMLPRYYRLRGWDKNGVPGRKKRKRLGIPFS
jgi:aldehyde:ferredoxin oxidoreductase